MAVDRSKVQIVRVDGLEERLEDIESKMGTGLSVGQMIWSQSSRKEDNPGFLPLFTGESVAIADYTALHNFLVNNPSLVVAKATYDALVADTNVDCPYYSIDNGYIYLPLLRNFINTVNAVETLESGESEADVTLNVNKTNLYPWVSYILLVDDIVTATGYVKTAGDSMTGDLTHTASTGSRFVDSLSNTYRIYSAADGSGNPQLRMYSLNNIGLFLNGADGDRPYYFDGTNRYKLLDESMDVSTWGSITGTITDQTDLTTYINNLIASGVASMLGRMNYNATVSINLHGGESYTVPSKGYIYISEFFAGASNTVSVTLNGNSLAVASSTSSDASALHMRVFYPVSQGDVLSVTNAASAYSLPLLSGFFAPQI